MTSDYEAEKLAARARRMDRRAERHAAESSEIDLDGLDFTLRAELAQQVKDGLITQAEADRIGDRLRLTNYTPEGK